jgi:hypothetical protein
VRRQGAVVALRPGGATLLALRLGLCRGILGGFALGDALLQILQPELELVRAQLLGAAAEPIAQKPLDQQAQLVVLSLAFLHRTLQRHLLLGGRGDQVPQHLLKDRGVVRQGGEVDLHTGMMNAAAASLPLLSAGHSHF